MDFFVFFVVVACLATFIFKLTKWQNGNTCPECNKSFTLNPTGNVREGNVSKAPTMLEFRCKHCGRIDWKETIGAEAKCPGCNESFALSITGIVREGKVSQKPATEEWRCTHCGRKEWREEESDDCTTPY